MSARNEPYGMCHCQHKASNALALAFHPLPPQHTRVHGTSTFWVLANMSTCGKRSRLARAWAGCHKVQGRGCPIFAKLELQNICAVQLGLYYYFVHAVAEIGEG